MTDGVISPSPLSSGELYESHGYRARRSIQEPQSLLAFDLVGSGSFDNELPILENAISVSGLTARGFEDDFYDYLYVIPAEIKLNEQSNLSDIPVLLWNAFRSAQTLATIAETEFDGLSFTGAPTPLAMRALGLYEYLLAVSPFNDSGTVSAALSFQLSTGLSVNLPITGQASGTTPFISIPNWASPVTRTLSFLTDIVSGRTGVEDRRALRETPRLSISYEHTATPTRFQRLVRSFAQPKTNLASMPDWSTHAAMGPDGLLSGSNSFEVSAVRPWVRAGDAVFFLAPGRLSEPEVATIESVSGQTVVLRREATQNWPGGTLLYRPMVGRVESGLSLTMLTNKVGSVPIKFDVDPGRENLPPVTARGALFQGREVFTFRANWAQTPTILFDQNVLRLDKGRGRIQVTTFDKIVKDTVEIGLTALSADDVYEIESFFIRHKGRVGEFWRSTNVFDAELSDDLVGSTAFARFEGTDLFEAYNGNAAHVAMEFVYADGTRDYRAVASMAADGPNSKTVLTFTQDWPFPRARSEVERVSWLRLYRFASDDMSVEWANDRVAQVQVNLRLLEVETAE